MGHVNIVDYPRPRCCFSNLSLVSVGMGGAQPPDPHQCFLSSSDVLGGIMNMEGVARWYLECSAVLQNVV